MENNTTSMPITISDYSEFTIAQMINLVLPPPIIIVGFVGNVLSFVVYNRKAFNNKPISLYMRMLALVDNAM